jgi:hypothetical protein
MNLHSILDGRAGALRLRGAAWERNSLAFRGYLYLIPRRGGDGRHRVVEAEGANLWQLLEALGEQAGFVAGAAVERLDARAVASGRALRRNPHGGKAHGAAA